MSDVVAQVLTVMAPFGDDAKIKDVARYLQDEFLIPYEEAVKIIYDAT